jgi:pyruvate formate lyase activating enzyme
MSVSISLNKPPAVALPFVPTESASTDSGPTRSAPTLKVGGISPFSATDFPGKLAAVLFVQGCPWRCGYCHNPHLQQRTSHSPITWDSVMALLKRRVGLLDGVVFSGGEPTMDGALFAAMQEVRAMGFAIGLHTACIYPRQLRAVLPLVDWVGFDVKADFGADLNTEDKPAAYATITGIAGSGSTVQECVEMILQSGCQYECRTTIHPDLHSPAQILAMANKLAALGVTHYALQVFRQQGCAGQTLAAVNLAGFPGQDLVQQIAPLFAHFTLRHAVADGLLA